MGFFYGPFFMGLFLWAFFYGPCFMALIYRDPTPVVRLLARWRRLAGRPG
jgi:hypothetical protein